MHSGMHKNIHAVLHNMHPEYTVGCMARPDMHAPAAGQGGLFDDVELTATPRRGEVLRGRHGQAMDRAIAAATEAEVVGAIDEGLLTTLRAGAWALDSMESRGAMYGPAKLLPGITEALRDAHMTPESRKTDTDAAIAALLGDLAEVGDDDDAAVPHAAD